MPPEIKYVSREHIVMAINRTSNYMAALLRGLPFHLEEETGQARWYTYDDVIRALTAKGYDREAVHEKLHNAVHDTGQWALAYGREVALSSTKEEANAA